MDTVDQNIPNLEPVLNPPITSTFNQSPKSALPKILIILIILLLLGISIVVFINYSQQNSNNNSPTITQSPTQAQPTSVSQMTPAQPTNTPNTSPTPQLSEKYKVDTDDDCVPDAVETAINYDPLVDECILNSCDDPNVTVEKAKPNNVIVILDSSGSMAQKTSDGRVKIDAAKEAVQTYVAAIPDTVRFGLMVYGHKGSSNSGDKAVSCSGIEMSYPIGTLDKNAVNQTINTFQATGWTPIADSLIKAGQEFANYAGQNNYIVIVSDGEETCDGDPVLQAQKLKDQGISTQIDVIGFSVNAQTKTQLEQIAQMGGGSYFEANTSTELIETMKNKAENVSKIAQYQGCLVDVYITQQLNCMNTRANKYSMYVAGKIDEVLGLYGHQKGEFSQEEYDLLLASWNTLGKTCYDDRVALINEFKKLNAEAAAKLKP